jgi:hypothetical protein
MSFLKNHKKEIDTLFIILQEHVKEKFEEEVKSIEEIKVKSRKRHLVYFRRTLMIILGEAFLKSYNQNEIASVVGLDRTSFIHHFKGHMNDYSVVKNYKEEYNTIRDAYLEKIGVE